LAFSASSGAWTATALQRTFIGLLALLLLPILASGVELAGRVLRIVDGDTLALLVEGADGREAQ